MCPLGLHFARCLSVVDHRYEPVSVVPDIENHVAIYWVCVFEYATNFRAAVPVNRFDNGFPRSNLVSCIGVLSLKNTNNGRRKSKYSDGLERLANRPSEGRSGPGVLSRFCEKILTVNEARDF
jgi:hypothetical protein